MVAIKKFPGHRLHVLLIFPLITAIAVYPFLPFARPSSSWHISVTHPQTLDYDHMHEKRTEPNGQESCHGFPGDQDSYGLGIRIGVYLQSITTTIANTYLPDDVVAMCAININNCFQIAIIAGLLFLTITKGPELFAVEAYLMILLFMFGVGAPSPYAATKNTKLGKWIKTLPVIAFVFYGCWFVFVGMDKMMPPPHIRESCPVNVFFFAKVNLFGGYRTFLKVMSVICCIFWFVGMGIVTLDWILKRFKSGWGDGREPTRYAPAPPYDFKGCEFSTFTRVVLFIICTEFTIKWSKIDGVGDIGGGTGQLFPGIIGVGGMGHILMKLVDGRREKKNLVSNEEAGSEKEVGSGDGILVDDKPKKRQLVSNEDAGLKGEVGSGDGEPQQNIGSNSTDMLPSGNAEIEEVTAAGEPECV